MSLAWFPPSETDHDFGKRELSAYEQFLEEQRQESAVLLDGTYQMMDERMCIHWAGKPKNGSQDPEDSRTEFRRMWKDPEAKLRDELGPTARDRQTKT